MTATASDGTLSDSKTFTWTVSDTNQAPVLTQPANQSSAEGATVSLQLAASDPDGTPVTYSATGLPASLSVSPASGLISGTLTFSSAGTYTVTATASDGALSNSKTFTWSITHVSQTPSITSLSPASGLVGTAVVISGANFGSTSGAGSVQFNGTAATATSWSATSISVQVPVGATTGAVVVTVGGQASNGVSFTVNAATGLPTPWTQQDIGGPALAGRAAYAAGTFSVVGAGVDIWDINDQFQFVWQTLDGDGEIVALVNSVQAADPWTKVGLMIREDLTGSARNVMAEVTSTHGMVFQRRITPGGLSTSTSSVFVPGSAPVWIRLVRSGNAFTGYYSIAGTAWTSFGSIAISMASHVYIGLAVTSHNPAQLTIATLSSVTVAAASPPPPSGTATTPAAEAGASARVLAGASATNSAVAVAAAERRPTSDTATSSEPTLEAFWQLDDGAGSMAFDASGHGMNGALVNGPLWTTGRFGGALGFDGIDDCVVTSFVENLPAWSVAAWVSSPAAPSSGPGSGPVDRGKNFQINWNHPDPALRGAVVITAGGRQIAASFGPLAAKSWYHLAGTYDGATLRAYVNGVLVTASAVPGGNPDLEPTPLVLGARADAPSHFAGVVSGVRIYRGAIGDAKVAELARPDTTPPMAPMLSAGPDHQAASLTWIAGTDPVSLYRVYRGTTMGGAKTALAIGLGSARSYSDDDAAPFTTYLLPGQRGQ